MSKIETQNVVKCLVLVVVYIILEKLVDENVRCLFGTVVYAQKKTLENQGS